MQNRGARIRTGDLCDPNAALYRTEPRPEMQASEDADRAGDRIRTGDLNLGKVALCQLSYTRARATGRI